MNTHLPRRVFLKGLGATLALPTLEAMLPVSRARAAAAQPPLRMAFVYHPNGVIVPDWKPAGEGTDYELSPTLQPLAKVKGEFQVLSGLDHNKARANGDGGGDHARANSTFLTGQQVRKTAGADIRAGISVDQVAAQAVGHQTPLPSLELSCDKTRGAGNCDSGYSCAYQFNFAWKNEQTPVPPEHNPRSVFERLFGGGGGPDNTLALRRTYQKSILDFVLEDARQLQGKLGRTDSQKVDEYLNSVREIERRIESAEQPGEPPPGFAKPRGIPDNYADHIRLMYDLMLVAFQTDTTRISTFLVAHDGSNRNYPQIKVSEGHHTLSHHQGDENKIRQIARIDRFHVEQFAYFLERLKETREGTGSLLDNCMIVYGSGHADGNSHSHHDLPMLLAGGGRGTLKPGRHVKFEDHVPVTNLYRAMLERMGTPIDSLGDSTGVLKHI